MNFNILHFINTKVMAAWGDHGLIHEVRYG